MSAQRYAAVLILVFPSVSFAQSPRADSARLDFSGLIYANYQYRGEDAARSANKFDLERAYLNFRMPAGERASVRITTDVYQQTASGSDAYYRGWSLRAKYAYLQYAYLDRKSVRANARAGLLQTVFIEHDETFWPRWIGNSPTERAGFFSSADAGIANTLTFPAANTEVYTTITNGPGYTSRETDRFKDFASRVTVRPWRSRAASPLRGVALSAWGYKGAIASRFVNGGTGQTGAVGDALERSRWGVHAGSSSPRLVMAAQYASRIDEGEKGNNTPASPRQLADSTGTLLSAYGLVRPFPSREGKAHPLSILARFDRVETNTDSNASYDNFIGGLIWDLSSRLSLSADYQEATPREGDPVAPTRTWFAHMVVRF
jgi:hypothetical protein